MKKLLILLLAALCALLPAFSVLAESTTLKTTVPSTHAITVKCGRNGVVLIDGKKYSGTFTIQAKRLGTLVITADPDSGYGLSQIAAEDLTGVTIKGRTATLSGIHDENTLTISFYQLPEVETPEDEPAVEPFEPMPDVDDPILSEPTLGDVVKLPYVYPTANILYDDYLGAGGGLGKLHIVFDGDYLPRDYELLDVFIDDEERGNSMLVCAFPDEAGKAAQRSLILSANQLVKLAQKQATEHILFENGSAIAEMDMTDLLGGDLVKLMALILEGGKRSPPRFLRAIGALWNLW